MRAARRPQLPRHRATAPTVNPVSNTTAPSAAGLRDTSALPEGATNWPPMKLPRACTAKYTTRSAASARLQAPDRARIALREKLCYQAAAAMPSLVFLAGPIAGRRYKLGDGEYVIGRRSDCQIFVPDMRVSRQHARLWRDGEGWTLEDLGSNNGTYINGVRAAERDRAPPRRRDHDREQQDPRRGAGLPTSEPKFPEGNAVTIVDVARSAR